MNLHEVVMKLAGPIDPIGETNADARRLENLKQLTELADRLVLDIDRIASSYKNNHQASMKAASEHCVKFLDDLGISG